MCCRYIILQPRKTTVWWGKSDYTNAFKWKIVQMIPNVFQSHLWNTIPCYIYSLNISESFVLEPKCLSYFTIEDFKGHYPWYYISVVTKRCKIRNCVALNNTNILQLCLAQILNQKCELIIILLLCHWEPGFVFSFDCKCKSLDESTGHKSHRFFQGMLDLWRSNSTGYSWSKLSSAVVTKGSEWM